MLDNETILLFLKQIWYSLIAYKHELYFFPLSTLTVHLNFSSVLKPKVGAYAIAKYGPNKECRIVSYNKTVVNVETAGRAVPYLMTCAPNRPPPEILFLRPVARPTTRPTRKSFLAHTFTIDKFRHWVYGRHIFMFIIDHKPTA